MPIYSINAPDGKTYSISGPPGATRQQVISRITQQQNRSTPAISANTDPMLDPTGTFGENLLAGIGKGFMDVGRGVKDVYLDTFGSEQAQQANDAKIAESRRLDAPLMDTGGGITGNIIGNVAAAIPTAVIPGVNTAAGAALVGAGLGALQPTVSDERMGNIGFGAAAGIGANLLGRVMARVIQPKTSQAAKGMLDKGVTLTPGQAMGGAAKRVEEALTSVPLVGDVVRGAQRGAVDDFNIVVGNKILGQIDKNIPKGMKAGHEMVKHVGDTLSKAYDDLMPNLSVTIDDTFKAEIRQLATMVDDLGDGGAQFKKIIKKQMIKRFSPSGGMKGETLKEIESELGALTRKYSKSLDVDQGRLGDALREAQATLRRLVERSNPDAAQQLKAINTGYAMLTRMEKAAAQAGSREGVFSPAALRSSVKAMDSSKRGRGVARGDALMQDIAEQAENVLGPTVPDSGTPLRLLTAGALSGMFLDPSFMLGAGAIAGTYGTKAGMRGLLGAVAKRPEGAGLLSDAIMRYGVPAAPALSRGLIPMK